MKYLSLEGLWYFWQSLKATLKSIREQLPSHASGIEPNPTTGAMELWSQNLNEVTATGLYNAMTCKNAKYQYSTLLVIGYYLGGYCTQVQTDVTTGKIAVRYQSNYSWSAWREI